MKTVLFFMSGYSWAEKRHRDAVLSYASAAHWRVRCVPYAQAEADRYNLLNSVGGTDVKGLIDFWRPDGCIVECGAAPSALQPDDFGAVPVVFLDRSPSTVRGKGVCIFSDSMSVAKSAFDELWRKEVKCYAFAGWYRTIGWSEQRRKTFEKLLADKGLTLQTLELKHGKAVRDEQVLLRQLNRLPRPFAVFAVNDLVADQIVSVCCKNGFSVPHDVAVVGVDNSEDICEGAMVSISSVPQGFEEAGRLACRQLAKLMDGKKDVGSLSFSAGKVVRRASSRLGGGDRRLTAALEFIRQNADFGIDVENVVQVMKCSRRTAEVLFRRQSGRSILEEILAVRLEKVKTLLKDCQMPIAAISDACGFSSLNDLDRVFKRAEGCSPLGYRKQNRN